MQGLNGAPMPDCMVLLCRAAWYSYAVLHGTPMQGLNGTPMQGLNSAPMQGLNGAPMQGAE